MECAFHSMFFTSTKHPHSYIAAGLASCSDTSSPTFSNSNVAFVEVAMGGAMFANGTAASLPPFFANNMMATTTGTSIHVQGSSSAFTDTIQFS